MPDETSLPAGQPGTDPAAGTQPQTEDPKPKTPGPVPYERFQEVNGKYQDLKARLDKIDEEKRAHELDLAKRRGDFDTLEQTWKQEKDQLTAALRAKTEESGIAAALLTQGLTVSANLIRAHAADTGIDLNADGAIARVVDSFKQAYPQLTQPTSDRDRSTPGSGPPARENGQEPDGTAMAARTVASLFTSGNPFAPKNPLRG